MLEEKEGQRSKGRRQAEEVDEILRVVQERIPKLVSGLVDSVFPKAQDLGKEAASFYKELRAAGMSDQDAFRLTRELIHSYDRTSILDTLLAKFVNVGFQPSGGPMGQRVGRKKILEDAEALRKELQAAEITAANAEELKGKIQKWYRGLRTMTGQKPVYPEVADDLRESWEKGDQARVEAIKRSIAKLAEFQATLQSGSK